MRIWVEELVELVVGIQDTGSSVDRQGQYHGENIVSIGGAIEEQNNLAFFYFFSLQALRASVNIAPVAGLSKEK